MFVRSWPDVAKIQNLTVTVISLLCLPGISSYEVKTVYIVADQESRSRVTLTKNIVFSVVVCTLIMRFLAILAKLLIPNQCWFVQNG